MIAFELRVAVLHWDTYIVTQILRQYLSHLPAFCDEGSDIAKP